MFVDDIERNVIIGKDGVSHGLRRENKGTPTENYIVAANAGPIIKNSIMVNELTPKKETASGSYILIGIARDQYGTGYVVESIVNKFTFELESMDVLYSMNAKKELAALNAPRATLNALPVTSSDSNIPSVLNIVNEHFPDILPEEVLKHFGYDRRPAGKIGESALYSSRNKMSQETKNALYNYAAQRDAIDKANKALYESERDQMVQAYNRDMKALESQFGEDTRIMQKEFFRLLREYDKQSAKGEKTGARDTQTIQELRDALKKQADSHKEDSAAWNREFNRLLREYDASGRQIDRLEAKVKHQQEAAKAKVESRKMTEARYKIERTAKELNRYLLHPTNTVHVPAAMQESVAKAMDALTMAISGRKGGINADRLSEYAYQLRELQKDPSGNAGKIADVQRKIQTLTERDARMQTAMSDLKEQYQALQSSGDPAAAQIYDENVAAWIQDCLDVIGETEWHLLSCFR